MKGSTKYLPSDSQLFSPQKSPSSKKRNPSGIIRKLQSLFGGLSQLRVQNSKACWPHLAI